MMLAVLASSFLWKKKSIMILYLFIHGHQFLQSGVKWLSDAVASALNMVIQYVTEILESAGIDGKYTENHT